jgi:hypothetical protein
MSKNSKARSKQKNKLQKAARRAAKKALYASYADLADNSKRRARKKKKAGHKFCFSSHPNGPCGNHGCKRDSCQAFQAECWRETLYRRELEAQKAA